MKAFLYPCRTVFLLFLGHCIVVAQNESIGEQASDSKILHSFLVTGPDTLLVEENGLVLAMPRWFSGRIRAG